MPRGVAKGTSAARRSASITGRRRSVASPASRRIAAEGPSWRSRRAAASTVAPEGYGKLRGVTRGGENPAPASSCCRRAASQRENGPGADDGGGGGREAV